MVHGRGHRQEVGVEAESSSLDDLAARTRVRKCTDRIFVIFADHFGTRAGRGLFGKREELE